MNIPAIVRSARLYVKVELLIAQIRLRNEVRRIALIAFAAVLALLGIGLINMALFAALESLWGPVWTPLALGLFDFALAGLALLVAATRHPGPELAMAEDMRDMTAATLEREIQVTLPSGGSLLGAIAGGGNSTAARVLVPVVGTIIAAMRRRKDEGGAKSG